MKKKSIFPHFPSMKMSKYHPTIFKLYLIIFGSMICNLSVIGQQKILSYSWSETPLAEVLKTLEKDDIYKFIFNYNDIKDKNVTATIKSQKIFSILDQILKNNNLSFRVDGNYILIKPTDNKKTESIFFVEGKVIDNHKKSLPGVTVRLAESNLGTATDQNGHFKLQVPLKTGQLIFSFVGFKSKKIAFEIGKELIVTLHEDVSNLEEVQVVAYGEQKKRTLVSSISSVKADDIKELPSHSLESLLQGHMAGVEINNLSGSPGGGGSIVAIRGYNSMFTEGEGSDRSYGTPLYIVDGVPMQAFTSPITGANTLSNIDPSMIESIEVLKDAASAAIYGSRAANGVILITTKKGRKGNAIFTSNVSYSSTWLPETPVISGGNLERRHHLEGLYNTVTPYQTADGQWKLPTSYEEVFANRKQDGAPEYDWFWGNGVGRDALILQDSLNAFYNNSIDWWRKQYRIGSIINANIQASGGNDMISYMVGAGYYKEKGIVQNTGFQRINLLSNFSIKTTPKLKLDLQTSLTYTDRSRGPGAGNSASKVEGITSDPMLTSSLLYPGEDVEERVLREFNSIDEKNIGYAARVNGILKYQLFRNLLFSVSGSIDFNQQNQNIFRPKALDSYSHFSKSEGNIGRNISILNENLLSYKLNIRNIHNIDILLGLSFQKDQTYINNGSGTNGPDDLIHYVGTTGWGNQDGLLNYNGKVRSAFTYSSDYEESRMNSYFGRITYNYKEKYLFESTLRRDGSSVFGENVRWATFPSFALGWAFSEEEFLKSIYWLSFGKIRASWGTSGKTFTQKYLAHGLMSPNDNTFHGNPSMEPNKEGGVINRSLSWEKTEQYDIGVDINLFNHRVQFVIDYYYRYTKGLLDKVTLPGNTFFHEFQWRNAAEISNEGLEIEFIADVLRESALSWRLKFNFSRNWNRFEKSANGYDMNGYIIGKPLYQMSVFDSEGFYNNISEVPTIYTAGKELQPLYAGTSYGIFFDGTRRIIDINGDGKITLEDQYYAASPLPIGHGGFANELKWKNLDLNILFTYSISRHAIKIYDDFRISPNSIGGPIYADVRNFQSWSKDHTNAEYPHSQIYTNNNVQYNGYYDSDIENVSFVRLKQVTLGYNLSERLTKKLSLQGLRIFITGENLFLISNYSGLDPELIDITNGSDNLRSYPLPRKFTAGLTINF